MKPLNDFLEKIPLNILNSARILGKFFIDYFKTKIDVNRSKNLQGSFQSKENSILGHSAVFTSSHIHWKD